MEGTLSQLFYLGLNYVDVNHNKVNVHCNKFKVNFCCSLALLIRCPGNIRLVDSSATQRI